MPISGLVELVDTWQPRAGAKRDTFCWNSIGAVGIRCVIECIVSRVI